MPVKQKFLTIFMLLLFGEATGTRFADGGRYVVHGTTFFSFG